MVFSGLVLPSKWPHSIIGKEEEYWIPISSEQRKKNDGVCETSILLFSCPTKYEAQEIR